MTDVPLCRFCTLPEEPNNPLWAPCACKGTLEWVHRDCLVQWTTSQTEDLLKTNVKPGEYRFDCELCKEDYSNVSCYVRNKPRWKVLLPWGLLWVVLSLLFILVVVTGGSDVAHDSQDSNTSHGALFYVFVFLGCVVMSIPGPRSPRREVPVSGSEENLPIKWHISNAVLTVQSLDTESNTKAIPSSASATDSLLHAVIEMEYP